AGTRGVCTGPAAQHARGPEPVRKAADLMTSKLNLDPTVVAKARELARRAGAPVVQLARTHTTVSVERAVLRLAGLDGADEDGMPWVNRLADAGRQTTGPEHGGAPAG